MNILQGFGRGMRIAITLDLAIYVGDILAVLSAPPKSSVMAMRIPRPNPCKIFMGMNSNLFRGTSLRLFPPYTPCPGVRILPEETGQHSAKPYGNFGPLGDLELFDLHFDTQPGYCWIMPNLNINRSFELDFGVCGGCTRS
jgi:hypothetical protein